MFIYAIIALTIFTIGVITGIRIKNNRMAYGVINLAEIRSKERDDIYK
jgi:hypothetical protein